MACRCDDYEPTVSKSTADKYKQQRDEYKRQADESIRLLCTVLGYLDENEPTTEGVNKNVWSKEVVAWWKRHQAADRIRSKAALAAKKKKAAEAKAKRDKAKAKKAALAKLTDAEKKALGL